ncbi:MAG: hypothetical protein ACK5KT_06720 [Dysgonomonas sp.]
MRDLREIEARYRRREESKGKINILKKRYIIILLLIIAFITNPSEDKHKSVVKSRIYSVIHSDLLISDDEMSGYESDIFVNQIVDTHVSYSNYLLFSTTNVTWKGDRMLIGIGIFGYVYIPEKIDEMLLNYKL